MSYILDALKKDPKSQQQLNIDPLRQYHHSNRQQGPIRGQLLFGLLAIITFVSCYLLFGGATWINKTWLTDNPQTVEQEPLRASYQTAHPMAEYFQHGQAYNEQLVTLRREQFELSLQQRQDKIAAEQQATEQKQTQIIAAQVDAAIAKHNLNAVQNTELTNRVSDVSTATPRNQNLDSKPTIELTAQQQEQVSPELLAAFNQAIDDTYAAEEQDQRVQSAIAKATANEDGPALSSNAADIQSQSQVEVPLLAQMPSSYRNSIPAIQFSLHMYSSDISSRWVRMNGQDYFEGGASPDGIVIEEIQPQFVIMSYRGRVFRLPALSSW